MALNVKQWRNEHLHRQRHQSVKYSPGFWLNGIKCFGASFFFEMKMSWSIKRERICERKMITRKQTTSTIGKNEAKNCIFSSFHWCLHYLLGKCTIRSGYFRWFTCNRRWDKRDIRKIIRLVPSCFICFDFSYFAHIELMYVCVYLVFRTFYFVAYERESAFCAILFAHIRNAYRDSSSIKLLQHNWHTHRCFDWMPRMRVSHRKQSKCSEQRDFRTKRACVSVCVCIFIFSSRVLFVRWLLFFFSACFFFLLFLFNVCVFSLFFLACLIIWTYSWYQLLLPLLLPLCCFTVAVSDSLVWSYVSHNNNNNNTCTQFQVEHLIYISHVYILFTLCSLFANYVIDLYKCMDFRVFRWTFLKLVGFILFLSVNFRCACSRLFSRFKIHKIVNCTFIN